MSDSVDDSLDALRSTLDRLNTEGLLGSEAPPFDPDERLWAQLRARVANDLAGTRVLDVSCDASFAFGFATRGAEVVLASREPADRVQREHLGDRPVAGRLKLRDGWEALDPERDGRFELVHCHGLLHRLLEPLALLRVLRAMIVSDGELLIASVQLADPDRSEYLRYMPEGDEAGLLPGRLAFRWLVQEAGFELQEEFGEHPGRLGNLLTLTSYLRATPA